MKRNIFEKDKLIKYLLIVSIITISIIGISYIQNLFPHFLQRVSLSFRSVFIPFVIAFFLSFIIGPLSNKLEEKLHLPKSLSIILSIFIGILVVLIIISVTIVFIVSQLTVIIQSLVTLVDNDILESLLREFITLIDENLDQNNINQLINGLIDEGITVERLFRLVGTSFVTVSAIASSLISTAFLIVLTPVFLYFMIKEKEVIFRSLSKIVPKTFRNDAIELGVRSNVVIKHYFIGQALMMFFTALFFILAYGVLSFFIPNFTFLYAIIFALLMGILCVIPYLGIWLGMAAPIVYLTTLHLEHGGPDNTIYLIGIIAVLIANLIQAVLESSVIQPAVFSKQVHIHPLAVLSSFIFFGGIFGLPGFLLAIPIAGTIKVVILYYRGSDDELTEVVQDKIDKEKITQKI
ncbi:MAG: AI-2E family transporter [Bacillota bacterium]